MPTDSPFLDLPRSDWIASNRSAFAIFDRFPVSKGHCLIVSRRLVRTWWEALPEEQADMLALVREAKQLLDERYSPAGYNIGINAGAAAGQTIFHLHVHLMPRYLGDAEHPEGGVRNVFPPKANYLAPQPSPDPLDPRESPRLLDSLEGRVLQSELIQALRKREHDRIDLVVSFVMPSGVDIVLRDLHDALSRGAAIRLLTTGYLGITSPDALLRLLDLAAASPIIDRGVFTVKAFDDDAVSFHPKGYLFWNSSTRSGQLFVGSGNLSRSGLAGGVEWTLHSRDVEDAVSSFEQLWYDPRSIAVDDQWVAEYRDRRQLIVDVTLVDEAPTAREPPEEAVGDIADADANVEGAGQPTPTPIQTEALEALEETRNDGYRAGLVVMATGLGKTWLAAFDSNRPQFSRVLFIAHRIEILLQARNIFRRLRPASRLGFFVGAERHRDAEVVFATVQTLHQNLDGFEPDAFDYIVVDEFHHAEAPTYRTVLSHFTPKFLLGLTATPERMDGADLLALCADNLVFRCDLVEGIVRNELVPFRYWGIPDTVDFTPIPWRNGRFVVGDLEIALVTEQRADAALREWRNRAGARTLGFCCSIAHAEYMADHFRRHGVPAAALHSQSPVGWRQEAVEQLTSGALQVLFTVDLFNEGVDLPAIDTVLFLRPTESPVVFLQQLGRGLRTSEDKDHLSVVDFVGNHQSFLTPLRTLLSLELGHRVTDREIAAALESGEFHLPAGCSIDYSLEAIDLLRGLVTTRPSRGMEFLRELCTQLYDEDGFRPTALQVALAGGNLAAGQQGWFQLMRDLGLLSPDEKAVMDVADTVLHEIETTSMTRSFKMVVLQVMFREGVLTSGVDVSLLAIRSLRLIDSDPRLAADVDRNSFPSLSEAPAGRWERYWRDNPVAAWSRSSLFRLSDDRLTPTFTIPETLADTFQAMVAELVEWRLHRYFSRREQTSSEDLVLRVSHASGKPIIRFDRAKTPDVPFGDTHFVADGVEYVGRFVQIALNFASLPGDNTNSLPNILRNWFGPAAGHPGTDHRVQLGRSETGWELSPLRSTDGQAGHQLPWFTTEQQAVEAIRRGDLEMAARSRALLNIPDLGSDDFVLTAERDHGSNSHMMQRGDLLLMRRRRHAPQTPSADAPLTEPSRSMSGQPAFRYSTEPEAAGPESDTALANIVERIDPALHLPMGKWLGQDFRRDAVPGLFGLSYNPGNWQAGHVSLPGSVVLFVTLTKEADRAGSEYVDRFESPSIFHWTSQNSVGPEGKKGRDVLAAIEDGRDIHLFVRNKRTEVSFTYCGMIVPQRHEGDRPMTVWFRLLSPLSTEMTRRFSSPGQ